MSKSTKDLLGGSVGLGEMEKGDYYKLLVLSTEVREQTDDKGNVKTFDNSGDPMMAIVARCKDLEDNETRTVWFAGGKFTALKNALEEAGADDIEEGDSFTLTMTGTHPKKPGKSAAKIYEITDYKKGDSKTKKALADSGKPKAPDDGRPSNIPAEAWAVMPEEARAAFREKAGPTKPDYMPQEAWDLLDDDTKLKMSAGF